MSNLPTVQHIYEAFGAGDVAGVLTRLADDVDWEYDTTDNGVPILAPGRGKDHALRYFAAVGEGLEIKKFEPVAFLESGNLVVALFDTDAVVKETGKSIRQEHEIHLWTCGEDGLVTRFCHKVDTHAYWLAYQKD